MNFVSCLNKKKMIEWLMIDDWLIDWLIAWLILFVSSQFTLNYVVWEQYFSLKERPKRKSSPDE